MSTFIKRLAEGLSEYEGWKLQVYDETKIMIEGNPFSMFLYYIESVARSDDYDDIKIDHDTIIIDVNTDSKQFIEELGSYYLENCGPKSLNDEWTAFNPAFGFYSS